MLMNEATEAVYVQEGSITLETLCPSLLYNYERTCILEVSVTCVTVTCVAGELQDYTTGATLDNFRIKSKYIII